MSNAWFMHVQSFFRTTIMVTIQFVYHAQRLLPLLISKGEYLTAESEKCIVAVSGRCDNFSDFIRKIENLLTIWRFVFPISYTPRAHTCRIHTQCQLMQPHFSTYNNSNIYPTAHSIINILQAILNIISLFFAWYQIII